MLLVVSVAQSIKWIKFLMWTLKKKFYIPINFNVWDISLCIYMFKQVLCISSYLINILKNVLLTFELVS